MRIWSHLSVSYIRIPYHIIHVCLTGVPRSSQARPSQAQPPQARPPGKPQRRADALAEVKKRRESVAAAAAAEAKLVVSNAEKEADNLLRVAEENAKSIREAASVKRKQPANTEKDVARRDRAKQQRYEKKQKVEGYVAAVQAQGVAELKTSLMQAKFRDLLASKGLVGEYESCLAEIEAEVAGEAFEESGGEGIEGAVA